MRVLIALMLLLGVGAMTGCYHDPYYYGHGYGRHERWEHRHDWHHDDDWHRHYY